LRFFAKVEFSKNGGIPNVVMFAIFAFGLFLLMYWNSRPGSEALVLIASGMVSFFTANPYFLQLPDWRTFMLEEAEALLHSSKVMNKNLKTCLTLSLLVIISAVQFACLDAVIGTMTTPSFFVGILFDNLSLLVGMILFGLYSDLPDQAVQILGAMPFLFMIFFSTTFSPGSGVKGVKELRYLFSRYYLWCMLPDDVGMEGCPENNTVLYLVLSSLLVPFLYILCKVGLGFYRKGHRGKEKSSQRESMKTVEFAELQLELFGEKALRNLTHLGTSMSQHEMQRIASRRSLTPNLHQIDTEDTSAEKDMEDTSDDDEQEFGNFVKFLNEDSDAGVVSTSPSKIAEACVNV